MIIEDDEEMRSLLQPETSIIVITAFGSEEVHQKAIQRGADSYLEKPLQFHELRRMVHGPLSSKVKRGG